MLSVGGTATRQLRLSARSPPEDAAVDDCLERPPHVIGRFRRISQSRQKLRHSNVAGGVDLHDHISRRKRHQQHKSDLPQRAAAQEKQQASQQHQRHGRAQIRLLVHQAADDSQDHAQRHQPEGNVMQDLPLGVQPHREVDDRYQLGQLGGLIGALIERALRAEADLIDKQHRDQQDDGDAHGQNY
jgi:hypothetical protein